MSCLHIRDLSVRFPTAEGFVAAVNNVSFDHIGGETLALIGETGCGKSVIASAIMGLLPMNARISGEILFGGRNLLEADRELLDEIRGRDIAAVFQNPSLALNPIQRIGKQIAEPLIVHSGMPKKEALFAVRKVLLKLGFSDINEHLRAYPFQFSGGMNQRVLIAAAMVMNPKVLIADEPTKGLDMELRDEVMKEILFIKQQNHSSLFLITHDFEMARMTADRIAVMYAGEIVEIARSGDFFQHPLHPYAQALEKSLPSNGFQPIPGNPPSGTEPPPGCKFHPRCPYAEEQCRRENPPILEYNSRKVKCFLYA